MTVYSEMPSTPKICAKFTWPLERNANVKCIIMKMPVSVVGYGSSPQEELCRTLGCVD